MPPRRFLRVVSLVDPTLDRIVSRSVFFLYI
jgi:hypothetical protein